MKVRAHYPTYFLVDFDEDTLKYSTETLSKPPPTVFSKLVELLNKKEYKKITCILQILLESPPRKFYVSVLGWFAINNMIPPPTLFLYISSLTAALNTERGVRHAIVFAKAIYPCLGKFTNFCCALKSVLNLEYIDPDLFHVLTSFINSSNAISLPGYNTREYWVIPRPMQSYRVSIGNNFMPTNNSLLPHLEAESKSQLKANFADSMKVAFNLPEESRYSYFVKILLNFEPTKVENSQQQQFLKAACYYTQSLLNEAKSIQWEAYDIHQKLKKMGKWVSCLSIQDKVPPPLHMLPIQRLIKISLTDGTLLEMIMFLSGFFEDIPEKYHLPNIYTRSIFEMISSIFNINSLRTDIVEALNDLEKILGINLSVFARRPFNVPRNTPIRYTQFLLLKSNSVIFQTPTLVHSMGHDQITNNPNLFFGYFYYVPNLASIEALPEVLRQITMNITAIEKYYFTAAAQIHINFINEQGQMFIKCIVSLALSKDLTVARAFSRLFYKIVKYNNLHFDLSPAFRFAFPNERMLKTCLMMNSLSSVEINALFSELLTNPVTSPISLPKIKRLLPICLKYGQKSKFSSTIAIMETNTDLKNHKNKYNNRNNNNNNRNNYGNNSSNNLSIRNLELPMPDTNELVILRSFLSFCKKPSDRSEFIDRMEKPTVPSVRALILFVLNSTTKDRSPMNATTTDYTIIDWLCFAFSKCSGKLNLENLAVKVIESIAESAISVCPKAFFRLIYGLLGSLFFQNNEKIIQLVDCLSPGRFPSFACCWMQIVMQKSIFPRFLKQNSAKLIYFCIRFIMSCFQLCEISPEVFYKPVARILMTVATAYPQFFVAYAPVILEKLDLKFNQFRNIILGASLSQDAELPPPMGFSCEQILFFNKISIEKGAKVTPEKIDFIVNVLKKAIFTHDKDNYNDENNDKPNINMRFVPKIYTHFVISCFSNFCDEFRELLIKIAEKLTGEYEFRMFFAAVADQLRFPNSLSFAAMNFALAYFDVCQSEHREMILLELLRRALCVSNPPASVQSLFRQIDLKYGNEIMKMLQDNVEYETYLEAKRIIGQLLIPRSPSGHITVIQK